MTLDRAISATSDPPAPGLDCKRTRCAWPLRSEPLPSSGWPIRDANLVSRYVVGHEMVHRKLDCQAACAAIRGGSSDLRIRGGSAYILRLQNGHEPIRE